MSAVVSQQRSPYQEPGAGLGPRGGCHFAVWAPLRTRVDLRLASREEDIPMDSCDTGYWTAEVDGIDHGERYEFVLDGAEAHPDPASHWQPGGVHEPSAVVDHSVFGWTDKTWAGAALEEYVTYELHVGAFTPEGMFDGVVSKLDYLRGLGVSAIELMPVAAFPGSRNWGYDGVYPWAVHEAYGGPDGLKRLVDQCHARGMAVVLDVVYNHLGPEGNYLGQFGPYFTDTYQTPWGSAVNYDGAWSDGVRAYVVGNARHWFQRYHIDALRLDAVHGIYDTGARHVLAELADAARECTEVCGRPCLLIAESDQNDNRLVACRDKGGYGLDAQWSDDFHHCMHTLVTGERDGYYEDFGSLSQLAKAFASGFVFDWAYSQHRRRHHGSSSAGIAGQQLVVCIQNHDQIGNRMLGERLGHLVSPEAARVAAGGLLTAPYVPLLFMGEEWSETAPFLYFVSHGDQGLVEAVRRGRSREFSAFAWKGEPPDPQDTETFVRSKLHWDQQQTEPHCHMLAFYRALLSLRSGTPALACLDPRATDVVVEEDAATIVLHRRHVAGSVACVFGFGDIAGRGWTSGFSGHRLIDAAECGFGGPGAVLPEHVDTGAEYPMPPWTFAVYQTEE